MTQMAYSVRSREWMDGAGLFELVVAGSVYEAALRVPNVFWGGRSHGGAVSRQAVGHSAHRDWRFTVKNSTPLESAAEKLCFPSDAQQRPTEKLHPSVAEKNALKKSPRSQPPTRACN